MAAFGEALPAIRKRVQRDLELPGLPREKLLATVVRLLERTAIRVGNEEYARSNNSHGLTTMRDKHLDINGWELRFCFIGKSRLKQNVVLNDRKIATVLRKCQELPGHDLFQYLDETGEICRIGSEDVNAYLRETAGDDFTAKDFRTWIGCCQMAVELEKIGPAESAQESKSKVVQAVKNAATKLGNTPATCRKYYVHPTIIEAYSDGSLLESMSRIPEQGPSSFLRREELCVLALLTRSTDSKERAA